jgi:hypothetical protein
MDIRRNIVIGRSSSNWVNDSKCCTCCTFLYLELSKLGGIKNKIELLVINIVSIKNFTNFSFFDP